MVRGLPSTSYVTAKMPSEVRTGKTHYNRCLGELPDPMPGPCVFILVTTLQANIAVLAGEETEHRSHLLNVTTVGI